MLFAPTFLFFKTHWPPPPPELVSPLQDIAMIDETRLFKLIFPNFPHYNLPSFMSSDETLWWPNLNALHQFPSWNNPSCSVPLKVCKFSSLNFLHDTTWPTKDSHPNPNKPWFLCSRPKGYWSSPSRPFKNVCMSMHHLSQPSTNPQYEYVW